MAVREQKALLGNETLMKKIIQSVLWATVGIIFGSFGVGGCFAPFGIAFSSVCGLPGFVGVIIGTAICGIDIWRNIIACAVAFFARLLLSRHIEINRHIKGVLYCLWAVLAAGVCGLFISNYSLESNMYFALTGIVGSAFSYVFSVAVSLANKRTVPTKIKYICLTVTVTVLLCGTMVSGGLWENAGLILMLLVMLCLVYKCGLYYVSTTAAIFSAGLLLLDGKYSYMFWFLLLGTVVAELLKGKGKYPVVLCYISSNVLINIFFRNSYNVWLLLLDILSAGVIFIVLPEKTIKRIVGLIAPFTKEMDFVAVKKTVKREKRYKPVISDNRDLASDVCRKCKKKLFCWVKNYSRTADIFDKMKKHIGDPDFAVPQELKQDCVCPDLVVNSCRTEFEKNSKDKIFSVNCVRSSTAKTGETVCGDTGNVFISECSRCVLCLTDGMGSGEAASEQSVKASNLLESLMKKGIGKRDALTVINDVLVQSGDETVLGVDLAVIDLLSGRCDILKANASPTFIVRGGGVFEISNVSMPVGMQDGSPDIKESKCTLIEGDRLVMVSDGFISRGTKHISDRMKSLSRMHTEPIAFAEGLMSFACEKKLSATDDLTVLVADIKNSGDA